MEINKIYNEDCFSRFAELADKSVDYVFTSPPYNRKRNDKYTHYDDRIQDYASFLRKLIHESMRVAKHAVFINIAATYYNKADVYKAIGDFADDIYGIIIWNKSNPLPNKPRVMVRAYEYILCFGNVKTNKNYVKDTFTTSVYGKMPLNHKAVMHPAAASYIVDNCTEVGSLIYDPFMGIGTTAMACRKLGRNYIGSEISRDYYNMAITNIPNIK